MIKMKCKIEWVYVGKLWVSIMIWNVLKDIVWNESCVLIEGARCKKKVLSQSELVEV